MNYSHIFGLFRNFNAPMVIHSELRSFQNVLVHRRGGQEDRNLVCSFHGLKKGGMNKGLKAFLKLKIEDCNPAKLSAVKNFC